MSTNSSPRESRRGSDVADVSGNKPKKFLNGWTKEQEKLMAEWADIAACYRWLHDRAEKKYYKLNLCISIPVIVLSTLTGAANFAVGSFIPAGETAIKGYVSAGLGSVSIFAGILTTLGNFFQYAQKSESNRVASIAWGKFNRLLKVELAINPMDRIDAMDFLKICRQDLDRLIEQAPQIPDDIIVDFEKVFKTIPNLSFPDICSDGIRHTSVFDSSKVRLGQIAADAVLHLRYKKNILANSVIPNIDKKIEDELSTKIEMRIKQLLPSAPTTPPPEEEHDMTSIVSNMETDWRRLLVGRKMLLQTPLKEDISGNTLREVRPEEIRINVVGTDGPITRTPPGSASSSSSERSSSPAPTGVVDPPSPEVAFS
jgi:hypothetical protein